MSKKVLISVGPIPARLDSVKFITNRFKGGLAIKTANFLVKKGFDLTVVAWKFTDVTGLKPDAKVVRVLDVYEYCKYIEENANNFDAFIMAAAVANLSPTHPYEDKFPSHLYKVGDVFNIEFEIAPRAIDIVKRVNPRCCLIGYKLFDAKSDEELIEIAKHTLNDSKANIIFANTPAEAKTRKIALFQDNTVLSMSFDEHLELMANAIEAKYFVTHIDATIFDHIDYGKFNKIMMCKQIVKQFESTLDSNYGTIAIKVSDDNDFVTTARGHKGEPVYIKYVNVDSGFICSEAKATLNAPLLSAYIKSGFDYVIHKHDTGYTGKHNDINKVDKIQNYTFPGTIQEFLTGIQSIGAGYDCMMELGHGYIEGYKVEQLDWSRYYDLFEDKYIRYPSDIDEIISLANVETWLDVGANTDTIAKYVLDPYTVYNDDKVTVSYSDDYTGKFELITLKNSINYLSTRELKILISWLKPNGVIIANTFAKAPNFRLKGDEAVYKDGDMIHHYLIKNNNEVYHHTFKDTNVEMLQYLGFKVEEYNDGKSLLLQYYTE